MKIVLGKHVNVVEALEAVIDFLLREKEAFRVGSGTLYVSLVDDEGKVLEDRGEYVLDREMRIVPSLRNKGSAGIYEYKALRRAVRDRMGSEVILLERERKRALRAVEHAQNMFQSSLRHGRREEAVNSWRIELENARAFLSRTEVQLRDLREFFRALEGKDQGTDIKILTSTFDRGFYAGKEGAIALLKTGGGKGLVYSYRGLKRVSLKDFTVDDYRGELILPVRAKKSRENME